MTESFGDLILEHLRDIRSRSAKRYWPSGGAAQSAKSTATPRSGVARVGERFIVRGGVPPFVFAG